MVAKPISKYETQVTCGQDCFHSCGGLAHEGLSARNRIRSSLGYGIARVGLRIPRKRKQKK